MMFSYTRVRGHEVSAQFDVPGVCVSVRRRGCCSMRFFFRSREDFKIIRGRASEREVGYITRYIEVAHDELAKVANKKKDRGREWGNAGWVCFEVLNW